MVHCPCCGGRSTNVYRCDVIVDETTDGESIECGYDLTGEFVRSWRYPTDVGRRDDGLVKVRFPMTCLECGDRRLLPLDYTDVGRVIRVGCLSCEDATKHRPTDEAIEYQIVRMGLDEWPDENGDEEEQPADQDTILSTPA